MVDIIGVGTKLNENMNVNNYYADIGIEWQAAAAVWYGR